MADFNDSVKSALEAMTQDGSIDEIIKKELSKTVQSIVSDQLRSYSEFGKALEAKISSELSIDLSTVNFSEYNQTILNLIQGNLNNAVTEDAAKKLNSDIEKLFGAPPKEIKFSEIIEKYKNENNDYERDEAEKIALIIEEKQHGNIRIGLNPKNTKGYSDEEINSWHDCEIYLSVRLDKEDGKKGKLSYTSDKSGLTPHQFMPTCLHGTSRLLYQLYCAGSTLIFDEGVDSEDYDVHYPNQWD